MNWLSLSALIALAFANFAIGGLVLARDYRKLSNRAFAGFAAAIGLWSAGIAGFLFVNNADAAIGWARLYYVAPILIAVFGFYFAYSFPDRTKVTSTLRYPLFTIAGGLLAILAFLPELFAIELVNHEWGKEVILNRLSYYIYTAFIITSFAVILFKMYRNEQDFDGVYSAQASLFFKTLTLAAIFGLAFNLVLPLFQNYRLVGLGPLFTSISVIGLGYAIVRHKMFDIRLVIARTLGYAFSIVLLAGIIGMLVFMATTLLFDVYLPVRVQLFIAITTATAALLFNNLKKYFDRATNSLFYRDAYDAQELFSQLNGVLVSGVNLQLVLTESSRLIKQSFKSEYCSFGVRDAAGGKYRFFGDKSNSVTAETLQDFDRLVSKYTDTVLAVDYLSSEDKKLKAALNDLGVAVLVRLTPQTKKRDAGLGYILVGPRKSGNPYTANDLKVMDTIATEMVIAIQNIIHYEEIQQFNTSLQAKIDEATRKLRRSNDKLKALDEAKDDFVSMASHQLRTPLTSIKGYISMVLEGDAGEINDIQRKLLEQSFASSQRMVFLIADLLNVSRLKTGKFVIEEMPVNLAETVGSEIEQLQTTAAGRQLTLRYEQPKVFPTMLLDENKTRQVIMNLVDNAIYYTPAGGTVEVSVKETASAVEFRVKDNGIGVPRSERPHLFTKFYRAGNARKARPDGTGLGLFMAKKVVVSQGGSIIFETEEGKGSTFGFIFPKSKMVPGTSQAVKA